VISRRTILLVASCAVAIAIPTSYSKGRTFEGRKQQPEKYIQENSALNSFPIVFARTLVGGEPEILRIIASAGLLLTGICIISVGFDYAQRNTSGEIKTTVPQDTVSQGASSVGEGLQVPKVETNNE
jgi:hypothetical protein